MSEYSLLWFKDTINGDWPTHASEDGMTTLCGLKIPTIHHPSPDDEVLECEECERLVGEMEVTE